MKLFNNKKNRYVFKIVFFFCYIFLVSVATSFNDDVILESKVSAFVKKHDMTRDRFIHSTITKTLDEELSSYNIQTNRFINSVRTDFTTYSSYLTFEKPEVKKFDLVNDNYNIEFSTSVMNLNFRQDINRTFLEAIRLRQYRKSSDSKYIDNGFDFSFYISSIMADKIITGSNGKFTNYDDILDYGSVGLDFSISVDGLIKNGHIRNIYYIESSNSISISLYKNLQDFIIFFGPQQEVFNGYSQILNYDFLATNSSIKNNLLFLSEVGFGHVNFADSVEHSESEQLSKIFEYMNYPYNFTWIQIIELSFLGLSTVFLLVCLIRSRHNWFTKISFINVSTSLFILFAFHLILKIIRYFEITRLTSYLLSNSIFGILTIAYFACGTLYFFSYYNKVSLFSKTKGELNNEKIN